MEEFKMLKDIDRDYPWAKWVLGAGIALIILIFVLGRIADANNEADAKRRRAEVEQVLSTAQIRVEAASQTLAQRRGDYPAYYTFGLSLESARQRIVGEQSTVAVLFGQLTIEQQQRNWTEADRLLDELETIAKEDASTIDRILGPPGTTGQGIFDILDAKSKEIDAGLVETVQRHIDDTRVYVDGLPRKILCGKPDAFLTYGPAYGLINRANGELGIARETLRILVDGLVDKPKARDEAYVADTTTDLARIEGDWHNGAADWLPARIDGANTTIGNASAYVNITFTGRQAEAQGIIQSAYNTLESARQACYRGELRSVESLVNSAIALAQNAETIARPTPVPTDTPEPPPTSVPVVIDFSSDDDTTSSDDTSYIDSSDDGYSYEDSTDTDDGGSYTDSTDDGGAYDE